MHGIVLQLSIGIGICSVRQQYSYTRVHRGRKEVVDTYTCTQQTQTHTRHDMT